MKKRIYKDSWLPLKPYDKLVVTDSYYLGICNKVKTSIVSNEYFASLELYLDEDNIDYLSCFLTSYFEDIISDSNIWNTFIRVHNRLYGKFLPFYDLEDYFMEEINHQDISFLIWYFLNTIQNEKVIAPYNAFILEIAETVYKVFDKAWDYAPENESLKPFYQIDENEGDFYVAREMISKILFETYLFHPDTQMKLVEKELELIEETEDQEHLLMFLREGQDVFLHTTHTQLLSLKGKDWAAEILGEKHPISRNYTNMSQRIEGFFFYKGQDEENVFIEHIASGMNFKMTKKSFDFASSIENINTILYLGIVKWNEEWWFSGIFFEQPFNADLVMDEKKSMQNKKKVDFLNSDKKRIKEFLENQLKAFKMANNGEQIAFMPSNRVNEFIIKYTEYYTNLLDAPEKEKKNSMEKLKDKDLFGKNGLKEKKDDETVVVFYNPLSGVELAYSVENAFPLPNNPYFEIEKSAEDVMFLFASSEFSKELAMYCIDHCKNDIPFLHEGPGLMYMDDIDFLLRFWKRENYFATPSITFTDK